MERLDVYVASADTERRLIEGMAVPYGETAEIGFSRFRFEPHSLQTARERTPLLLGHDTNQPVGVLSALTEADDGARVAFRVDRTPEGDRALAQARSGSRGGLSIGFEVDRFTASDDVTVIHEASIYEVSLVAVPAFAGANVERVAAQRDANQEEEETVETEEDANVDGEETEEETEENAGDDEQEEETVDTPNLADRRPVIRAERRARPRMRPGELVQTMVRAERGDGGAQRLLTAALTAVDTSDVPGLLPPSYTSDLLGTIDADRTLAETFRSAPPLPGTGMAVTKPKWTTLPDGNWVVDGQATPSNAIAIGTQEAFVEQWAFGVLVSYAALERSTPDFAEAIYREAINDYYADVERKIHDELIGALGTLTATVGEAVAAFVNARHSRPNVLLVSGDVYGDYIDATGPGYPLYTTGNVDASGRVAEYIAGLRLVLAPFLGPGTSLVTHTSVIDHRESSPIRVSAQVIGVNSVELGVYSFALFDTDKPGAVFPVGTVAPTAIGNGGDGRAALYANRGETEPRPLGAGDDKAKSKR